MKKLLTIGVILTLAIVLDVAAQDQQVDPAARLTQYIASRPQEKLFVHLDKPFYSVSDEIWFKVYLVDAMNHLPRKASVVYVELINNQEEIVAKRNIQVVNGGGFGDIVIPDLSLPSGEYVLRAYTSYMRNFDDSFFFYQKINLIDGMEQADPEKQTADASSINIDFFPEGGELIAGQVNFLAFKVSGNFDINDEIKGKIVDNTGAEITEFRTENFGMGLFPVIPVKEATMKALVDYKGKSYEFPLPVPLQSGFSLSVRNTGTNLVLVAKHTDQAAMDGAYVVVHHRGEILGVVSPNGKPYIQSAFKQEKLPAGIISFTLFDANGLPRRERIAFVENENDSRETIAIKADQDFYRTRQKIALTFDKEADNDFTGNASVSITNLNLVPRESRKSHLLSYLLLSSDLKGEIENPGYYFDEENESRLKHLDLLMLTQGWRRFSWKQVLDKNPPLFKFPIEEGFTIEGKTVDYYNRKKAVSGELKLNVIENILASQTTTSNDSGYFFFPNLMIGDTATLVIQSNKLKKKKKTASDNNNVHIEVFEQKTPNVMIPDFVKDIQFEEEIEVESYIEAYNKIVSIDSAFKLGEGIYLLGEFEVTSTKTETAVENPFVQAEILYGSPTKRVVVDSLNRIVPSNRVLDILRTTSGVRVQGSFPNQTVQIRGISSANSGTTPLIIVDGVITTLDVLNSIPVADVSYIDILKGPDAAIFGSQGANGAISVFTRTGEVPDKKGPRVGIVDFKFPGFTLARKFYTPDYSEKSDQHKKPDYRTTLYWNPEINLSSGEPVEFYSSDEKGTYLIHLEGITSEGKVVLEEKMIEVK
ncbi:MAG: TonB-dependent receptor plug domain-containing protein [Bacteroidota bacterium]